MSRIIVAILFLVIAAGITVFVAMPQWEGVVEGRAAIAELQSLQRELTELAASRDALTTEYNAIAETDLAKLRAIAPADRGTSAVLTDFEELARRGTLSLDQVDFTASEKASAATGLGATGIATLRPYGVIPVTLSLRGVYENFREFLTALEQNLRLVDVGEIILSAAQGKDSAITLKAALYYRR